MREYEYTIMILKISCSRSALHFHYLNSLPNYFQSSIHYTKMKIPYLTSFTENKITHFEWWLFTGRLTKFQVD